MSEQPDAFAAEVDAFVREVSLGGDETVSPAQNRLSTATRPRADERTKEKIR
jgi:hypothetical protein